MRLLKTSFSYIYYEFINYPVYANLSYLWNFGVSSGICLAIQLVTGIFLAMHYVPSADFAFLSVEHIMRDVNYGWLIRYIHANGASFFFLLVYLHIGRNLFFNSYLKPREILWCSGVIILILMILTAFLGYVLPWGQMSFWAATVITSLFSALPIIGTVIVQWLWGGYSVDTATLNRFFSLHYLLPFILLGLVFIHLLLLHSHGSTNPLGLMLKEDKIPFHPYYTVKDVFGLIIFFFIFFSFVFFAPNYLGHTDNYIPADPLVTPAHIVPEWYFLPFYAILRSIPDKLGGVIMLALALLVLLVLPFIIHERFFRSTFISYCHRFNFWSVVCVYILLGWIGGNPIEVPFYQVGQYLTTLYFIFFLFAFNWANLINFHFTAWFWLTRTWWYSYDTLRTTIDEFMWHRTVPNWWYFININPYFKGKWIMVMWNGVVGYEKYSFLNNSSTSMVFNQKHLILKILTK